MEPNQTAAPVAQPVMAAAPMEASPIPPVQPPPPASRPAPVYMEDHSHIGYIVLAVVFLLVGLAAGAGGGYYYATLQQPTDITANPGTNYKIATEPPAPATTSPDTSGTSASTTVKVNPFE